MALTQTSDSDQFAVTLFHVQSVVVDIFTLLTRLTYSLTAEKIDIS